VDANRLEVNGLAKLTLLDRHSEEDRRNMVAACAIVFVPCHNQKAIVRFDKLDIGAKIILKPSVSLRDGAIMHVVIEIRNDEGDRRQGSEVIRKARKGLVAGAGHIGEIHPRVVLAHKRRKCRQWIRLTANPQKSP
jgi:hypothetical protein